MLKLQIPTINPILECRTKLSYWSKAKEGKEKDEATTTIKARLGGKNQTGTHNGLLWRNGAHQKVTMINTPTNGLNNLKAKAKVKPKPSGVTSINDLAIPRTGALTIPTALVEHPYLHLTHGVPPAIEVAMLLAAAMQLLSASLLNEKESHTTTQRQGAKGIKVIGIGKVIIFLQATALTRQLLPYTKSLLQNRNKIGGRHLNSDQFFLTHSPRTTPRCA